MLWSEIELIRDQVARRRENRLWSFYFAYRDYRWISHFLGRSGQRPVTMTYLQFHWGRRNLNKENLPIHNLSRLAEVAEIANSLSVGQTDFLAELTPYCIEARYGDFRDSLSEIIDKRGAEIIYRQTQGFFEWLYQMRFSKKLKFLKFF